MAWVDLHEGILEEFIEAAAAQVDEANAHAAQNLANWLAKVRASKDRMLDEKRFKRLINPRKPYVRPPRTLAAEQKRRKVEREKERLATDPEFLARRRAQKAAYARRANNIAA